MLLCALQVDGTGNKFQSVAELIATEKAARAARAGKVEISEEETVSVILCATQPY